MLFSKWLNSVRRRPESSRCSRSRRGSALTQRFQPRLEALDERVLLHAGEDHAIGLAVTTALPPPTKVLPIDGHPMDIFRDAILYTPLIDPHGSDADPIAIHIHPTVKIVIDGQDVVIPDNVGHVGSAGLMPHHIHDTTGKIHVESLIADHKFQLQDFFAIWGKTFNSQEILGFHADATHTITMTVNGQPSTAFGSLVLEDLDEI